MLSVENGTYQIQGNDLIDVVNKFGSPLYLYDADKIKQQIDLLKESFIKSDLQIMFAMKSLSNINILKLMKKWGAGLDCVSIQEVETGLKIGYLPSQILFTPNCVSFDEIIEGVELGVKINIDSLSMLKKYGKKYGNKKPCCIRINPHIMAGGNSKISTGHVGSKFGISIMQEKEILDIVSEYDMHINGLHMHTGSDILESDTFLTAADILYNIAKDFKQLDFIDFGSGFKVAYKEGDIVTDIPSLGQKLSASFNSFCKAYGRKLKMYFEPGKFLVSEAGYFLVKTNVVKQTPACVFAGVDSGLNHLIRPMMYDSHHDIINISNPNGARKVYTVVGYICETDTLGNDRSLNEVRVGDILAIKNAGAYGISMASNYNSRFRPAEVLIYKGDLHLIRKREVLEDILRLQEDLEL